MEASRPQCGAQAVRGRSRPHPCHDVCVPQGREWVSEECVVYNLIWLSKPLVVSLTVDSDSR